MKISGKNETDLLSEISFYTVVKKIPITLKLVSSFTNSSASACMFGSLSEIGAIFLFSSPLTKIAQALLIFCEVKNTLEYLVASIPLTRNSNDPGLEIVQ